MISSLKITALNYIAGNFYTYESDPKLLQMPSDLSNELMKGVLKNPEYKPTEKSPTLKATVVDLADIPSAHMDEKVRWVFSTCRLTLEKLTLSKDFVHAFKRTSEEIKTPKDADCKLINTFAVALSKLPELQSKLNEVEGYTLGGPLLEKLRYLKLEEIEDKRGLSLADQELTEDKLGVLAKICPNVEMLYLEDCGKISTLPREFTKLKVLEIYNNRLIAGPGFTTQGLHDLAEMNPSIERLLFRRCDNCKTLPEKQLLQLKTLTFIDSYPDLRKAKIFCPNLEELFVPFMCFWENFPEYSQTSKLTVVAINPKIRLLLDELDLHELVIKYPALKLIILIVKSYKKIAWDVPEGILVTVIDPSLKRGLSLDFFSKHMAEEELLKYMDVSKEFAQLLTRRELMRKRYEKIGK